jgi:acetyl esterase
LPSSPAVDATVRCVILCAPVIDPLGRYHYAKKLKAAGPPYPTLVDEVLPGHDAYGQTEEAMAEGCPALALEAMNQAPRRTRGAAPRGG